MPARITLFSTTRRRKRLSGMGLGSCGLASRLRPGGFHIRVGREDTPGVAAPPERMVSLGGSEFGSSYFRRVRLGSTKRHYRLQQARRNWEPGVLGNRLQLLGFSIENLIGLARILNGVDPTTVRFSWPTPIEAFEMA